MGRGCFDRGNENAAPHRAPHHAQPRHAACRTDTSLPSYTRGGNLSLHCAPRGRCWLGICPQLVCYLCMPVDCSSQTACRRDQPRGQADRGLVARICRGSWTSPGPLYHKPSASVYPHGSGGSGRGCTRATGAAGADLKCSQYPTPTPYTTTSPLPSPQSIPSPVPKTRGVRTSRRSASPVTDGQCPGLGRFLLEGGSGQDYSSGPADPSSFALAHSDLGPRTPDPNPDLGPRLSNH